jgi:hypothetical protein
LKAATTNLHPLTVYRCRGANLFLLQSQYFLKD